MWPLRRDQCWATTRCHWSTAKAACRVKQPGGDRHAQNSQAGSILQSYKACELVQSVGHASLTYVYQCPVHATVAAPNLQSMLQTCKIYVTVLRQRPARSEVAPHLELEDALQEGDQQHNACVRRGFRILAIRRLQARRQRGHGVGPQPDVYALTAGTGARRGGWDVFVCLCLLSSHPGPSLPHGRNSRLRHEPARRSAARVRAQQVLKSACQFTCLTPAITCSSCALHLPRLQTFRACIRIGRLCGRNRDV